MHDCLQPDDVVQLLKDLDPPTTLSDAEVRSALLQMDLNHDGGISFEELRQWWSSDTRAPAQTANNPDAGANKAFFLITGGPTSLRVISLVCGLLFITSGVIGLILQLAVGSSRSATPSF